MMERTSRLVFLISTTIAAITYAAVTGIIVPGAQWWGFGALVLGVCAARFFFSIAAALVLLLIYTAPALFLVLFGREEYHLLSVWMAALTGVAVGAADWKRWHLPGRWRWPLMTWALLIALTWPVVAGREADFSMVALMSPDTPNAIRGGPPAPSVAWVISVALGHSLAFLWMDVLWTRFGNGRIGVMEQSILPAMLASAVISAAAGLYQDQVDLAFAAGSFWPITERAAGLMLDANSFGSASAIWCAAAVALMWRLGMSTAVGLSLFAVLVVGMWASGSRTSFLVALTGGLGIAAAASRQVGVARVASVVGVGAAALTIGGLLTISTKDASTPLRRLLPMLGTERAVSVSEFVSGLWIRDGYGPAAMAAIREHPVAGVGIGAFNILTSDYSHLVRGPRLPADNAQNWWRHQVAELGAGAVAPFAVSLLVIGLILHRPVDDAAPQIVLKATLIALGVVNLVSVSTQHPALLLTFVTIVVWLALLTGIDAAGRVEAHRPAWWATMIALVGVVVGTQVWSAHHDLRVPNRALRLGYPYSYGFSAEETGPSGPVRWTARAAAVVLPVEHRFLDITTWTLHPDISERPVQVRIKKDGELVADFTSSDAQAHTTTLEMRPGQQRVLIEVDVSRSFGTGRGVRIAAEWRRE